MTATHGDRQPIHFPPLANADLETVSSWLQAVRAKSCRGSVVQSRSKSSLSHAATDLRSDPVIPIHGPGTWAATVVGAGLAFRSAAGLDYLTGVAKHTGRGLGTELISRFSAQLFPDYSDVLTIVVTPRHANRASCRALEKAGFILTWVGPLDSDDPADSGDPAI